MSRWHCTGGSTSALSISCVAFVRARARASMPRSLWSACTQRMSAHRRTQASTQREESHAVYTCTGRGNRYNLYRFRYRCHNLKTTHLHTHTGTEHREERAGAIAPRPHTHQSHTHPSPQADTPASRPAEPPPSPTPHRAPVPIPGPVQYTSCLFMRYHRGCRLYPACGRAIHRIAIKTLLVVSLRAPCPLHQRWGL